MSDRWRKHRPSDLQRFKDALRRIRDEEGKVCEDYELCEHEVCRSSYTAWAVADQALAVSDE